MDVIKKAIVDWLREILIGGIISNLSGMFDSVNEKVGEAIVEVGKSPSAWNSSIFNMVQNLSETVMIPIAGVILAFVMTLELIQLVTDRNNLHDIDTWMFFKWSFKTAAAVLIVTNTWNIVMGIFDAAQSVVNSAGGVIVSDASIDISSVVANLETCLAEMELGPLFGLWFQSLFVGITMWALTICIFIIVYGRMIEIYLVTSIAPIPTGQLLSAAALTVCKLHNIGDAAPIRLAPLELLNGLQEANELLLGAGEQITGVEATSTADSLPDLPQLEQGYPMPDPTVDFAQMYQFGYTDGNTMLPLSKERARELFLQDVPIFVLNSDNTEYMVLDTEDLGAHSGIFGVERTEWESVRDTLQPRRDIVAPKQPDTLSYLHDDTAKTQPENYLKNAEMALEDNYGMIDGIINNAPKQTVAEQEERSSILAKLKAPVEATNRTEKHAPKRSAEKEL